jgi:hypothetical protein
VSWSIEFRQFGQPVWVGSSSAGVGIGPVVGELKKKSSGIARM